MKKILSALMPIFMICNVGAHSNNANLVINANESGTCNKLGTKNNKNKIIKIKNKKSKIKKKSKWSSYIKDNPKKSLLITISPILLCLSRRPLNEVRLKMIYKELDKKLSEEDAKGEMNSGVRFVNYRFSDGKELICKTISHDHKFNFTFENEKLAFEKIKELKLNHPESEFNKHLADIFDYHYGWNNDYVVYEKAQKSDWHEIIKNKDYKFKLRWFQEFLRQFVGTLKYLDDNGLSHGDPIIDNVAITLDQKHMPIVTLYDYGLFHEKGNLDNTHIKLFENNEKNGKYTSEKHEVWLRDMDYTGTLKLLNTCQLIEEKLFSDEELKEINKDTNKIGKFICSILNQNLDKILNEKGLTTYTKTLEYIYDIVSKN